MSITQINTALLVISFAYHQAGKRKLSFDVLFC